MSEDIMLSRIEILVQQKKYKEAERQLRELLARNPNNVQLLSLLAEVYLQQDNYDNAETIINNAIGLTPDIPQLYYIKSRIALQQDKYDDAEAHLERSIQLDPHDADYFALLGNIKLLRKQFKKALDLANQALEIDPENILGLNTRSTALMKLNKKKDSFDTIEGALHEDPNNAYTHANYGWGLLEKGNHKKALLHFKESLQNEPSFAYAQAGMLEAIKASNPVYKLFLKYSFLMSKLTAKYQWGVIIGFYLTFRFLRFAAKNNETLQPFLTPLIIALTIIAFSTWVITPISNLFLRFNKYGQVLLDKKEKLSSNFVASSLFLFIAGLLLYFTTSVEEYIPIAAFGFAMMVPFSVMFSPSKFKNALLIYAVGISLIGIGAISITFSTGIIVNNLSTIFIFGFIAFQWVANYIMIKEDNK